MFPFQAMAGLRVLDLTRLLPGPLATSWMAAMGAEVIKVEAPGIGDYLRGMPPPGLFDRLNAGKKSVVLDLKTPAGRDAFLSLADSAAVVIEGFRPGVMEQLGLGWETLHVRRPGLLYVALSGYGAHSPHRGRAGHDINYLAMAGVLDLVGPAGGPPAIPGVQIADIAGGSMQALIGTLAALLERERTGEGRFVDVSMTHGSAALLAIPLTSARNGVMPRRGADLLSGRYACYNVYGTRDGRYLAVGALEPKFWRELCAALDRPEWADEQFAGDPRRTEIRGEIAAIFEQRDAGEWWTLLGDRDCCVTPVRTVMEAVADLGFDFGANGPGPELGEHTAAILTGAPAAATPATP